MKIDIVDNLTIQIKAPSQLLSLPVGDVFYSAPSEKDWWEMMEWAFENDIVCNRARGTSVKFAHEKDVLAFVLRWS